MADGRFMKVQTDKILRKKKLTHQSNNQHSEEEKMTYEYLFELLILILLLLYIHVYVKLIYLEDGQQRSKTMLNLIKYSSNFLVLVF